MTAFYGFVESNILYLAKSDKGSIYFQTPAVARGPAREYAPPSGEDS